ncbi:serine/arginine-rich splicing factor 5-like [Clarias magur]|uniref:Serine/arginine-rich splicing factor 5-like n=1 Tax=Clarias magur TaxID=1594786 RepID=A0A8J4U0C5_CLAMG|nr:serine/arginine-rich splicing factor 5-like [Clarias magur]
MKNAIEKLNGTELNGRKLKLYEDRKRRYGFTLTHTRPLTLECVHHTLLHWWLCVYTLNKKLKSRPSHPECVPSHPLHLLAAG